VSRRSHILVAACVAAPAIALIAWYMLARHPRYEYSGTIETREIQIGSKVGGRVTEVPVEEGQQVKAGTLLVRFESDQMQAQRQQWQAKVDQAEADLDRMLRGNRPEEIAQAEATAGAQRAQFEEARIGPRPQELRQAEADYAAAQADVVNAEASYRRMESLVRSDTVSRQQFDDARDKRDASQQRAESARQRLALLQAGTRAEDLEAAEQHYKQAEAAAVLARKGFRREDIAAARGRFAEAVGHLRELDVLLREAELKAPDDAIVQTVSVRPGDLVPANRIVVSLLESSQLWVRIYVPETEVGRVRVGQRATVRVDSFPGRLFRGEVQQVSSQAEFLPRNVQTRDDRQHEVFGVKVQVPNNDGALKSGMSASVRFE
jgi:HlyD family secretion protein